MPGFVCILQLWVEIVFIGTLHCAVTGIQYVYLPTGWGKELHRAKTHQQVLTAALWLCRKRRAEFRPWYCTENYLSWDLEGSQWTSTRIWTWQRYPSTPPALFQWITKLWMNRNKVSTWPYTRICEYFKCWHSAEIVPYSWKTYSEKMVSATHLYQQCKVSKECTMKMLV